MTITPPAPLSPYTAPFLPLTNITPLTYRDGETYLLDLEGLKFYVNHTLRDFVNENYTALGDQFVIEVNRVIDVVNTQLAAQTDANDVAIADLTDYVNEQVQAIITASITVSDPVIYGVVNNPATQSRGKIDALDAAVLIAAKIYADGQNTAQKGYIDNQDTALNVALTAYTDNAVTALKSVRPVALKDFGAVGDGVANDRNAIVAAINSGKPLDWGSGTYKISGVYVVGTLTADAVWYSSGAKIIVDSANTAIQYALYINTVGFNVTIRGALTIDGSMKAQSGIRFNHTTTTYADFFAEQLKVKNLYRASSAMVGGDGIFITGAWTNVTLIRPDVRNVIMAAGAGVSGSQGVAGITINSYAAGQTPQEITILHPYISTIYCEDATYLMDQDGIRIFTEDDIVGTTTLFDTHFTILGGTVINVHGRALKSQAEFGNVNGMKIVRDRNALLAMGTNGAMPEIDFQVGGGIVENVECRYTSAVPNRIVNFSGTRLTGGKVSTGLQVRGLKASIFGAAASVQMGSVISVQGFEAARTSINITDVEIIQVSNPLNANFLTVSGTNVSTEIYARLTNIFANLGVSAPSPAVGYLAYRTGSVLVPLFVSATNIVNTRVPGSALYSGSDTAGSVTAVSAGQNIRVA